MSVQWSKSHIDGLAPGTQFRIEATMPGKGFFQVVFENARGSEVFHYSVNIDPPNVEYTGNPVIRNWSHCWHLGRKREWDWFGDTIGTVKDVPIRLGKKFTLVLQALNDGIEIMVDGKHVYTANGWSEGEMRDISQLKIKGTITVHRVDEQEFSGQKTVENPSVPAKLEFARFGFGRGLGVGTRIRIVGTPVAPRRFQFDLVESANGNGGGEQNIHFHFNPRFSEKQVVRNNLIKGMGWQTEERDGGFPFVFGRQFTVDIVGVLGNRVQVLIDEKPFCEYSPRGGDLSAVDRLEIQGDVTVKSVTMFGTSAGDVFGGQFGADIGQMMMGMGQSGIGMMQYMSG